MYFLYRLKKLKLDATNEVSKTNENCMSLISIRLDHLLIYQLNFVGYFDLF